MKKDVLAYCWLDDGCLVWKSQWFSLRWMLRKRFYPYRVPTWVDRDVTENSVLGRCWKMLLSSCDKLAFAYFLGLDISPWSIVFGSRGPKRRVRLCLGYVTEIDWPWRPGRKPFRNWASKPPHVSLQLMFLTALIMTVRSSRIRQTVKLARKNQYLFMSPSFPGPEFGYSKRSCTAHLFSARDPGKERK